MPLETFGPLAVASSSGANAREARSVSSASSNAAFAASSARGDDKSRSVIEIPSPAPNVAAYLSPFIRLDLQTRLAIVEYRDSETGEVQQQYPSPRVVREYQQNLPEESDLRTESEGQNTVAAKPHDTTGSTERKSTAPAAEASTALSPAASPASTSFKGGQKV